mmetsp:Transcript_23094/g.46108  ORF Transcript_23094/g.46108 Transcript_23094/m.46108 type:complete len:128 (-) Transcript_23094:51-434(-)
MISEVTRVVREETAQEVPYPEADEKNHCHTGGRGSSIFRRALRQIFGGRVLRCWVRRRRGPGGLVAGGKHHRNGSGTRQQLVVVGRRARNSSTRSIFERRERTGERERENENLFLRWLQNFATRMSI